MRDTIDMKVASRFWKTLTAGIAKDYCKPKKIRVDGRVTVVFWQDGTTTVVRCGDDDKPNEYNAFCAALGKRIFGNNSALKRAVEQTEKEYAFNDDNAMRKEDVLGVLDDLEKLKL